MNSARDVYVANGNGRIVKLSAGGSTATELPFRQEGSGALAVNAGGNVYTADYVNDRVLALNPGAAEPSEHPFEGLNRPSGIAADEHDNLYALRHLQQPGA